MQIFSSHFVSFLYMKYFNEYFNVFKRIFACNRDIYRYIYIYIYIYICVSIYMCIYIYIYIYKNFPPNAIVWLPHPRSGDIQGQETFLAHSADKHTCNYETECWSHHPSLSTLTSKRLSCSKMKWEATYKFTSKSHSQTTSSS